MDTMPFPVPNFPPVVGQPTWDLAIFYPVQGGWTEERYLELAYQENWLIEYSEGCVEVLPMPSIEHQLILRFLLDALRAFVEPRNLGMVLFAPLPVAILPRKYREPDLIFNFTENHKKRAKKHYEGADLVMEIVSPDDRSHDRDHRDKRRDYAAAGIPEYWIVDPQEKRIAVLALADGQYAEHGSFALGETASSKLLEGFSVDVSAVFDSAND